MRSQGYRCSTTCGDAPTVVVALPAVVEDWGVSTPAAAALPGRHVRSGRRGCRPPDGALAAPAVLHYYRKLTAGAGKKSKYKETSRGGLAINGIEC